MSKAFTKDDDGGADVLVVPRAPLPECSPNYVTARGLGLLQAEREQLLRARPVEPGEKAALAQRLAELEARLASAELVEHGSHPPEDVRFGANVRVRHESGKEATYRIVGVDEADAAHGRLAFSSPLARALLGKRVGDVVEIRTPRHPASVTEEIELCALGYGEDGAP